MNFQKRTETNKPYPYTRNFMKLRVLKAEEIVSPTEEYSNWLSNAKWSALKTQIQVTLYGLSGLY